MHTAVARLTKLAIVTAFMDIATETEALLQGLAQDTSMSEAPASEVVETTAVLETVQSTEAQTEAGQPTAVLVSQQVGDGNTVTTAAETYVVTDSDTAQPAEAPEVAASGIEQPSMAPPVGTEDAETSVTTDQQAQQPVANGTDISTSGLAEAHITAIADGLSEKAQTEPERGRSRKRRARWGPPANKVAEPVADTAADGEPTGRKKRRSRWEEPAPAAEDSQQLAVVDMSNGSGFPHEIVLAGGIKVSLTSQPALLLMCRSCASS